MASLIRYQLMAKDMDVDAADPTLSASERAEHLFQQTLAVASGLRTRGEAAGQYQLQIWRNWEIDPNLAAVQRATTERDSQYVASRWPRVMASRWPREMAS